MEPKTIPSAVFQKRAGGKKHGWTHNRLSIVSYKFQNGLMYTVINNLEEVVEVKFPTLISLHLFNGKGT